MIYAKRTIESWLQCTIATEGQYTLAYSLFSNPTDTRTLIPFLDEIQNHYFVLPKHIVADAGYGSEQTIMISFRTENEKQ